MTKKKRVERSKEKSVVGLPSTDAKADPNQLKLFSEEEHTHTPSENPNRAEVLSEAKRAAIKDPDPIALVKASEPGTLIFLKAQGTRVTARRFKGGVENGSSVEDLEDLEEARKRFMALLRESVKDGYKATPAQQFIQRELEFGEGVYVGREVNIPPFEQSKVDEDVSHYTEEQRESLDHADKVLAELGDFIERHGKVWQEALEATWVVRKGAEKYEEHLSPVLDVAGDKASRGLEKLSDRVETVAEKATNKADSIRTKVTAFEKKLEKVAENLERTAAKLEKQGEEKTGDDKIADQASAEARRALAGEIKTQKSSPGFRRRLARAGSASLRVLSEGIQLIGKLATAGRRALAFTLDFSGRVLLKAFGKAKDTVESTAVELSGGVRVGLFHALFNGGVFGSIYFPSLKEGQEKGGYGKNVYIDDGASLASPLLSMGRNRRGKTGVSINLWFVKASFDKKSETLFLGVPGVMGVVFGRDIERGPFFAWGNAEGVNPLLSLFGVYGFAIYTPLLGWPSKHIVRPIAKFFATNATKVRAWLGRVFKRNKQEKQERAAAEASRKQRAQESTYATSIREI